MNNSKRQIVILQRGWVVVGNVSKDGTEFTISDGSVIRRWGTTNGIGQLALGGPTKDTILDAVGTMYAHELTLVARIDVVNGPDGKPVI